VGIESEHAENTKSFHRAADAVSYAASRDFAGFSSFAGANCTYYSTSIFAATDLSNGYIKSIILGGVTFRLMPCTCCV